MEMRMPLDMFPEKWINEARLQGGTRAGTIERLHLVSPFPYHLGDFPDARRGGFELLPLGGRRINIKPR